MANRNSLTFSIQMFSYEVFGVKVWRWCIHGRFNLRRLLSLFHWLLHSGGNVVAERGQPHVGEVIESSTMEFTAESRVLHGAPPFGTFVKIDSYPVVYAITYDVVTESLEPNRRPTAYGKTEEDLRLEQPQIFELLRTEFTSLVIGYRDDNGIAQLLPPQPPRIHSFVHFCSAEEIANFTDRSHYLRPIFNQARVPADELTIAAIRNAYRARGENGQYLVRAGKEVSRLLKDDYARLHSILERIYV